MSNLNGWFGHIDALMNYLRVVRADRTDAGAFKIFGAPVISGLDETEVVVSGEVEYEVDGRRCNLAAGLRSISQGMAVVVF